MYNRITFVERHTITCLGTKTRNLGFVLDVGLVGLNEGIIDVDLGLTDLDLGLESGLDSKDLSLTCS